jgi:hypothetical protein
VALLQPLRVGLIKLLGAPGVARDPATGAAVTGDGVARVDQLVAALSALGWADKAQGVLAPPVDVAAPGDHLAQQREEEEAGHVWGSLEGLLLVTLPLCLAPDPVAHYIFFCVLRALLHVLLSHAIFSSFIARAQWCHHCSTLLGRVLVFCVPDVGDKVIAADDYEAIAALHPSTIASIVIANMRYLPPQPTTPNLALTRAAEVRKGTRSHERG